MKKQTNQTSGTSPTVPCVWPRALRPDLAASYLSTTPGNVEFLMRTGALKYKLIAGVRVVLREELDNYVENLPDDTGKLNEPRQATLARKRLAA